ncbi:glucose dehydrogenase-like [Sarcoptes scabiei]|nr:glucose dehydrogenase-like [Sarcoptes scabiei]
MEKRIELEKRGQTCDQIKELNLDNCRSPTIVGLDDSFVNLESLSMINSGLTTEKKFLRCYRISTILTDMIVITKKSKTKKKTMMLVEEEESEEFNPDEEDEEDDDIYDEEDEEGEDQLKGQKRKQTEDGDEVVDGKNKKVQLNDSSKSKSDESMENKEDDLAVPAE